MSLAVLKLGISHSQNELSHLLMRTVIQLKAPEHAYKWTLSSGH